MPLPSSSRRRPRRVSPEILGAPRTRSDQLPDPEPLIATLAGGVLEVIAGARDVDQLARWLDVAPYHALVTRAGLAARARSAEGRPAKQPVYRVASVHRSQPADGVVEATVIVEMPARTRAIAIRLEGYDARWRATSLAVL
ncbi:Rv3235 family protein [Microbacterium amylolyticum]|uniref:3-hydroxyacyl-CoA dehydrogenase n=1 Tax=Microbacterium amylolyticum TaxID=936337 RepID=A0ABS4ZJZ6_9MICO|nr:Rv3235 family protein [Microbacterium amylolyticum]MBP2437604.1 hypothetical protein [Microbacterium amylolyticum]